MNQPARTAYHECIDRVELHQVTLSEAEQMEFISELRAQLVRKLAALRAAKNSSRASFQAKPSP